MKLSIDENKFYTFSAMSIGNNGDDDENDRPSAIIYILHFLSFFWKVLLALIPPRYKFLTFLVFSFLL